MCFVAHPSTFDFVMASSRSGGGNVSPPDIVIRTDTDDDVVDDSDYDDHNDRSSGRPRRSTLSALSVDIRRSIVSLLPAEADRRLHSHVGSTAALCASVLCMFYLLFSPFPYSGFMALQLVPGLTHDSAGTYAGMLSSSFMVGRTLSSFPWGVAADTYGRRFVLVFSLANSALLSVLFGLSSSFWWAMTVRFLMGLGNGTMLVARTLVSELARGDKDLEAKSMGAVMSMVGYGMLISPTAGGLLSDPMKQYPDAHWFGGRFDRFLTTYPFFLPNLIGALLCLACVFFVFLTIEETLPAERRRSPRHFVPDLVRWMVGVPVGLWARLKAGCCRRKDGALKGAEYEPLRASILRASVYGRTSVVANPGGSEHTNEDSVDDDLRILESKDCAELAALLSSEPSRASYSSSMRRPSARSSLVGRPSSVVVRKSILESVPQEEERDEASPPQGEETAEGKVRAILSNKSTRNHLVSYWLNGFASVTASEAFPLFCMSKKGGLGLDERAIGGILTGAGVLFCICQYFIFAFCMKRFGLYRSITYGCLLSCVPVVLTPLSLLLKGWAVYVFLTALMAVTTIFNSVFYAGVTIGTNRTVDATQRATLNGLSSLGSSVGRGLGPVFAGALVTFSMSSGVFPARFGSVVVYSAITACGLVALGVTRALSEDEVVKEEERANELGDEKGANSA